MRLQELPDRGELPFISTTSASSLALADALEIVPICPVMGFSVYKPGRVPRAWKTGPLDRQTAALNAARSRALDRLRQEAQMAGGNTVVEIAMTRRTHEAVGGGVEVVAAGTAVRGATASSGAVVLTGLSMSDYAKLKHAGLRPAGLLAASAAYYVVASVPTVRAQSSMLSRFDNQELADFTHGVALARELVLADLQQQAHALACDGIIGISIDHQMETVPTSRSGSAGEDLIITVHAAGNGVLSNEATPSTRTSVGLAIAQTSGRQSGPWSAGPGM